MRVLLYLEKPDLEVVVIIDEPPPRFGAARGRAVFSADELDAVLEHNPSASEFRVICAAKLAVNGTVAHDAVDAAPVSGYGDDDAFYQ